MPCNHLFHQDLQLQYVDWEVRTLFIGTFNPGWILPNNYAEWFYGRTGNNEFWSILPTIHTGESLLNEDAETWKNFCRGHHIGITDIITSLTNADEHNPEHVMMIKGFKDHNLAAFAKLQTNIPQILENYPRIEQVCITRKTLPPLWRELFQSTFDWVQAHPERNIQIKRLRSPSRVARRGVVGNFTDFIANHWQQVGGYQIK